MMSYRYRAVMMGALIACAALSAVPTRADNCAYSGRAYGLFVNVPPLAPLTFSDTGVLPASGGSLSASLLVADVPNVAHAEALSAHASGASCAAASDASVANLLLFSGRNIQTSADVVSSAAHADCGGASGSSTIVNLVFGGTPIVVSGSPNQTVTIPGVATLVINEQLTTPGSTDITVNALHLTTVLGEEVIVSSAHSDVSCASPVAPGTWGRIKSLYR